MRTIALVLSLCFTMNAFAGFASQSKLGTLMNEYEYAVTVEWDQKDQSVLQAQNLLLVESLKEMIAQGELTSEDIRSFVQEKEFTVQRDLLQKIELLGPGASSEELARLLTENSKSLYHRGASWAPTAGHFLVATLVISVVGILVAALSSANTTCTFKYQDANGDEFWSCRL